SGGLFEKMPAGSHGPKSLPDILTCLKPRKRASVRRISALPDRHNRTGSWADCNCGERWSSQKPPAARKNLQVAESLSRRVSLKSRIISRQRCPVGGPKPFGG